MNRVELKGFFQSIILGSFIVVSTLGCGGAPNLQSSDPAEQEVVISGGTETQAGGGAASEQGDGMDNQDGSNNGSNNNNDSSTSSPSPTTPSSSPSPSPSSTPMSELDCRACTASGKVLICHRPPGNPSASHTLCIGRSALRAHLDHGDSEGACRR